MSSDNLKSTAKAIPTIHEAVHTPVDYSATTGETLFSTTPGGKSDFIFYTLDNFHVV